MCSCAQSVGIHSAHIIGITCATFQGVGGGKIHIQSIEFYLLGIMGLGMMKKFRSVEILPKLGSGGKGV